MIARNFGLPALLLLTALSRIAGAQTTVILRTSQPQSILGMPVVLTATVAPLTATGLVTFYDGVTMVGDAPLVVGSASVSTSLLGCGSHKLKAYYAGDASNAAATSNIVAGTVNARPSSGSFAQGISLLAYLAVVGDFNGDGKADIALGVSDFGFLRVLLSNGDGTFRIGTFNGALSVAPVGVGDFNGDGKTDLVVVDLFTSMLSILLGNGDGTMRAPIPVIPAGLTVVVADFNGDGKADLAITSATSATTSILLGKGDGTFQPGLAYSSGLTGLTATKGGDFNGDGIPDLVAANGFGLNILLGNGNGTFQPPVPIPGAAGVFALTGLVVGDFNKDGKADVAFANTNTTAPVNILLGNGDGTFQPPVGYGSATYPNLIIGDFNGDGNADLAAGNQSGLSILPGNGDGTFQPPINSAVVGAIGMAAADFNGDGKTDLVNNGFLLLGTTTSLTLVGGTPQSTAIGTPFPNPLQVMLRDGGNPVSGATVTFCQLTLGSGSPQCVLPGGPGPGAGFPGTAVTDAFGIARVTATANFVPGSYVIGANYQGLSVPFSLTNFGTASRMTASGGTPQFAAVGTAFGNALQVTVKDAGGNLAGGVAVTFTAPSSGASAMLSNSTVVTDAFGMASITAVANASAGSYNVTATVGGATAAFSLTNLSAGRSNLASGKSATQSSTYSGYAGAAPASAVDGNTDGNFFDGSVTATNADANAWWQVDLGVPSTVNTIVIWNRTDCCASRLGDYWVFVSNTPFNPTDTPAALQSRAGTFSSHQVTTPNPFTIIAAGGVQGRYVRVQLTGVNNLSLAEVQVVGTPASANSNLALGKTATQSSTYFGYATAGPASAVDGYTDGNFFDGSVTATNLETNAWWQVDLGSSSSINSIVVWNRTDFCCVSRLSDYWVFVSDTPFLPSDTPATLQNRAGTFSSHQTTVPNPSFSVAVGTQGRYIRVQLGATNYLSLAEVQVLGSGAPVTADLAQGRPAAQSSIYPGYVSASPSTAVDGNTDGIFYDGSVTSTNFEANPWWQVDLGVSSFISSIVIWNRTDCCSDRLGDYWVFVSDAPFLASDTLATLQFRPGTFSSHQTAAPNPSTIIRPGSIAAGTQGRYVRVQLTGANYLSLAEVQVFGR